MYTYLTHVFRGVVMVLKKTMTLATVSETQRDQVVWCARYKLYVVVHAISAVHSTESVPPRITTVICMPLSQEWRGDWGDNSMLWTRRRRARLGLVKNDQDNAFWMSFNDFCVAFRSLYVCRWYDPR